MADDTALKERLQRASDGPVPATASDRWPAARVTCARAKRSR